MNSVLLADDHAMFRQGLKLMLDSFRQVRVAGEAEDGEQALAFIEQHRPALAILDVALPKMNGIDVVRAVRTRKIGTKCIMLTMHDEPEIARSALEAGAYAYILKGHTFDDLQVALTDVLAGRTFISTSMALPVRGAADPGTDRTTALTAREQQVLSLIAQGQANKEIAVKLSISVRTVESHRARIMRKTGMNSHAALIHYAAKRMISAVK